MFYCSLLSSPLSRCAFFPSTTLFRSLVRDHARGGGRRVRSRRADAVTHHERVVRARARQGGLADGARQPRVRGRAARLCVAADRKSTRLNSSHLVISYAVFCLEKKKK